MKKLIAILCLLALLMVSCKMDQSDNEIQILEYKSPQTTVLNYEDLKTKAAVINKLRSLTKSKEKTATRIIVDSLNNFSVDLDHVLLITDHLGQKTYTFKMKRNEEAPYLENLVLMQQNEESFEARIFEYDDTVLLNRFASNNDLITALKNHVRVYKLDHKTTINPSFKEIECTDIITTWVETPGTTCLSGNHTYEDGSACIYWGTINMALP